MKVPPAVLRDELAVRTREAEDRLQVSPPLIEPVPSPHPDVLPAQRAHGGLAATAAGEELPVLKAFRQFLETERRRTRNRMLVLSGIFGALMLILVAVVFIVGSAHLKRLRGEVGTIQTDMNVVKSQAAESLAQAEDRLKSFSDSAELMRQDLLKGMEIAEGTRDTLDSRLTAYDSEMDDVRKLILLLRRSHTALQKSIALIERERESQAPPRETIMQGIERRQSRYTADRLEPPVEDVSTPNGTGTTPAPPPALILSIVPRGGSRAVTWRMPIPE